MTPEEKKRLERRLRNMSPKELHDLKKEVLALLNRALIRSVSVKNKNRHDIEEER
jgi:hypothetical protein